MTLSLRIVHTSSNLFTSGCLNFSLKFTLLFEGLEIFIVKAWNTDREVLAQFPISTRILNGENELKNYVDNVYVKAPRVAEAANLKIKDLKAGMKRLA